MTDKSVVYRLRAEIGDFKQKIASAGSSLRELGKDAAGLDAKNAKLRQGMTHVGDVAGKVGLAAAAGLGAAIKMAMDWETSWASVMKTVDETKTTTYADLEEDLRNLAKTMPVAHADIAAVASAAGALGVQTDSVASFTKTMLMLGEATDDLSADQAATSIAQMANVMGTSAEDIDNLGAALVFLGNNGASTEGQIVQMAQRIAGAGSLIGLAEADVLGIANAVASTGMEVEAGGTAISKVFTEMAKAASSGSPKLKDFGAVAGMTADEFQRMFKEDPAQAFTEFTVGLDQLNKSGGDVYSTLKNVGLGGGRVSDALLRAAGAGDMLAGSIRDGRKAWQDNSALAEEYAKRLDTTAAKTQVAWNNIKDAAIGFGEAALPVLATGAEKVAAFAEAIGNLPAPVKTAATGLGGITAVLGGGLWFTTKTINGVHDMRVALNNLGVSSDKTSGKLSKVGPALKTAGFIAGAALMVKAIDDIYNATDKAGTGVEAMTRGILGFKTSSGLVGDLDGLGDALDRLFDKDWDDTADDWLRDKLPGLGDNKGLKEAKAEIEQLDLALANLVDTGNKGIAKDFIDSLDLSAEKTKTLTKMLPEYADALAGEENAAKLAADANEEHSDSLDDTKKSAEETAEAIEDMVDKMREERREAIRRANAELAYQSAILDAREAVKETLKEHGKVLAENGDLLKGEEEAGIEAKGALIDLASAWNDLSDKQKQARGGRKAAIDQFVEMAEQLGMSEEAARKFAKRLFDLPPKVETKIATELVGEQEAEDKLNNLARPRQALIYTHTKGSNAGPLEKADGGFIRGPGGPRDDLIPAWLSNGEYVVNAAATAKHRALLESINAQRFASGGYVGGAGAAPTSVSASLSSSDISRLANALIQARPLFGDVHLSGDGAFEREQRERARIRAGGGVVF